MARFVAALVGVALTGCYSPPDLPDFEGVPLAGLEDVCRPPSDGRVGCTVGGDSLDVGSCGLGGERFRMLGLEAPAPAEGLTPAECYGTEAADELDRILKGRSATTTFDRVCDDGAGLSLAYVWLVGTDAEDLIDEDPGDDFRMPEPDPNDPTREPEAAVLINEWMLSKGFARLADEDFAPVTELALGGRLLRAKSVAEGRGVGLWGSCGVDGG